MSFLNGKVDDYFDSMFDFDKDGLLNMEEQAMQFDIINKLDEERKRSSIFGSDDDNDSGEGFDDD